MTDKQKHQSLVLDYYPFEPGSDAAKFVERMSNYAKYEPATELTNEDAKELARLFDTYIVKEWAS